MQRVNQGITSDRIDVENLGEAVEEACQEIVYHRKFVENDYERIEYIKNTIKNKKSNKSQNRYVTELPKELSDFWTSVNREINVKQLYVKEEQVYYLPENTPTLAGLRFQRTGLYLGDIKKKRFEPSQALAMNLKKDEFNLTIDFDVGDNRVIKYLKGETLAVANITDKDDKGWALICVSGYPLGFGKLENQVVKNKYQAGWRMM
jgi:NOL1/NOP2/fmu family ribosome biogenesis protein